MFYRGIKYTYNHSNGGFIDYWKLTGDLWFQFLNNADSFGFWYSFGLFLVMFTKTPYWMFIKPLGQVFSSTSVFTGRMTVHESEGKEFVDINNSNVSKSKTLKIFGIPFFKYRGKLTEKDWEIIVK